VKYKTILADPPWPQELSGKRAGRHSGAKSLPYPTMLVYDIIHLPIRELAAEGCHLWLWTTDQFLRQGFDVLESWGFTYLKPITWVKPSGCGNYFVSRTQTMLFGYKEKCIFPLDRYKPNLLLANVSRNHSEKPGASYDLIESISPEPRLELFARRKRMGWDVWGNEVDSDIVLPLTP
jgi:N6-adenosine-specific RNA methylase IME4